MAQPEVVISKFPVAHKDNNKDFRYFMHKGLVLFPPQLKISLSLNISTFHRGFLMGFCLFVLKGFSCVCVCLGVLPAYVYSHHVCLVSVEFRRYQTPGTGGVDG